MKTDAIMKMDTLMKTNDIVSIDKKHMKINTLMTTVYEWYLFLSGIR